MRDRVMGNFRIEWAEEDSHSKAQRYRLVLRNLAGPLEPKKFLGQDDPARSEAVPEQKSPVNAVVKNSEPSKAPQTSAGPQQDPWDPFLKAVEDADR